MKRHNRYPKFKKGPNGEKLCRGCGAIVPKGRRTWCSSECYNERCPMMVMSALRRRDKGICCKCGMNTEAERETHREKANLIWCRWDSDSVKLLAPVGMDYNSLQWWHADHIKEFSEGGETILSNMQTLCIPCHKEKTREWRKRRIQK